METNPERVTTLELFFDLVFVFVITQLTSVLVDDLSWRTLANVAVMLGLIFYMYGGYAWLTNSVPARGARRQGLLLGGMAGYMVIAIAVPDAFDDTGLTFALALAVVTAIHAFLFIRSAGADSSAAMRRLAPTNIAAVLAVVVGGAIGGDVQIILWTVAALYEWFWPWLFGAFGSPAGEVHFGIRPAHFVERHNLLIIVAIGESVVAIGIGASHLPVDFELVALVILGLAVSAALWWAHFGRGEEEGAVAAMEQSDAAGRERIAIQAFGYALYPILLGVILVAAGIEEAIAHPDEDLATAYALALSGGVALFILGDLLMRSILGLGRTGWRTGAALAPLVAIPIGTEVSAAAGLATAAVLLAAALALEHGAVSPATPR
jgi:low temperature requirement protein LtrA